MSKPAVKDLKAQIELCMIRDRFRFARELYGKNNRQSLADRIERSIKLADRRRSTVPKVSYPEILPISAKAAEIGEVLKANQVIIVAGETGSGKTTQLPKICLEIGRGVFGTIGHTQPRRIAARTVAHRIAAELGVKFGDQVGYQVRFTDQSSPETHIKVMTDGILLAETSHDRFLENYDTLIIDEAHERSLNIDFLMGYIKRILPKRPDLKVIITSATIDLDRFSRHFNNAPIVEVSGRTYPVEVHYKPMTESLRSKDTDELLNQGILDALHEVLQMERRQSSIGDILIFLSGEREIRELALSIRRLNLRNLDILPLYSRLSVSEQNKVFQRHGVRRVVLCTNVAETSLTVPGIRYVIDPGFARISRYSYRSKVQQLPIEAISQASAEQRKGRCGRISDGVCFRLYSEEDFLGRPRFTQPEIMRTNLGSVILQMLNLRMGDISKFPFVERPDQRQINDGFHLLNEIQAVDQNRKITRLGKDVGKFPIDLRLARMMIEAGKTGCLKELLIITSALSVQDPRERPHEHQQAADQAHREYWHEQSDFLTLVDLWNSYEDQRQALTQNQLRKYCRQKYLSFMRMREWRDVHRQLKLMCRDLKLKENHNPADYASVHRALLSGLLGNIGEKSDDNEYTGARNRKLYIFPGSSQFKHKPKWIVSSELVETTRLYARNVAWIDSAWIEPLARHMVKRNFFEPYFDESKGQVFVYEEVTLYGVIIVKKRRVDFASVNPLQAREIFIQEGLVSQRLNSKAGFYRHNNLLIREVEKLESKSRKRDILVELTRLYEFYDDKLPAKVVSMIELDAFRKETEAKTPKLLYLDKDMLMKQDVSLSEALYPNSIKLADAELKLEYHFDPQHEDDGVSVNVPIAILRQVSKAQIDWIIPGLLREKCLALIRSLPKSLRKNFVPAPDYADKVIADLAYDGRELTVVLSEKLHRLTGVIVPESSFGPDGLDPHLNMNIRVVDDKGKVLGAGRNLNNLLSQFSLEANMGFSEREAHDIEQSGLTTWSFGELPEQVEIRQSNVRINGYPALIDKGDSVSIEVLDNALSADTASEQGLLRLILLQLIEQRKYLEKNIPGFEKFALFYATRGSRAELLTSTVMAIFKYTFIEGKSLIRSQAAFEERLNEKKHLLGTMNQVAGILEAILRQSLIIDKQLKADSSVQYQLAFDDIRRQLERLLEPGFLGKVPLSWLTHFPRFLKAVEFRMEKLQGNTKRDLNNVLEIETHANKFYELDNQMASSLQHYRWMLEEYRVSLFAQPIGTSIPVSGKRLDREWQKSFRTSASK
ncbi:MAG: ATP-dependent RNA helicase HrpA [Pseudomonadales bacterium]